MSKSKCKKHTVLGALLEVEMLKSVHRCGAKQISESKVLKTAGLGPLFEVRMWFCVAGARDSAPSTK